MGTSVVPYAGEHRSRALAFNARLLAAGVADCHIPDEPPPPPGTEGKPVVHKDWYVLLHDDEVRGGFMLQRQPFWLQGRLEDVRNIQSPVTEGIIDKRYSSLALLMMRALMREHPRVFAVGMGSVEEPFPRMLAALRWRLEPVPFFFRIARARRVLRRLRPLRSRPARRWGADALAFSGLSSPAVRVAQGGWSSGGELRCRELTARDGWGDWADELWAQARSEHSMIGLRDRDALNAWYPVSDRYVACAFSEGQRVVGWAVLLDTPMQDHKHFADLRVGTILDALCLPGREAEVAARAALVLRERGVDLLVANFNQARWTKGLNDAGFVAYGSNYLLGCSPRLCSDLEPISENWSSIHLTRGDGDGRLHL